MCTNTRTTVLEAAMNLWLRLLRVLISGFWREKLNLPADASHLAFRVWFHDLDTSLHMNNGRYLTMMDLGRLDLMIRSGLIKTAMQKKWTPIASSIAIRFKREVRLFGRFRMESRIVGWDKTHVVIEQTTFLETGRHRGQIASHALFKGGLYERHNKRFVPIDELMAAIGVQEPSPPLSVEVESFLAADRAMKAATQQAQYANDVI